MKLFNDARPVILSMDNFLQFSANPQKFLDAL